MEEVLKEIGEEAVEARFETLRYKSTPEIGPGTFVIAVYRKVNGSSFVAKGLGLPAAKGQKYRLFGTWEENKKFRCKDLKVRTFEEIIPATKNGIVNYLSSGQIKGIGKVIAERIYDKFGNDTLSILDNDVDRLKEVEGIGTVRLAKITESYQENRGARDLIVFLAQYGISAARAVSIFKEYGRNSITVVRDNPYKLCEMAGIAFPTADRIAVQTGFDRHSPERLKASIIWNMGEFEHKGNLCVTPVSLAKAVFSLVGEDWTFQAVTEMISAMSAKGNSLSAYNGMIYLARTADAEDNVARAAAGMMRFPVEVPDDLDEQINEQQNGMVFDPEQRNAIKTALTNSFSIITGGPGTGKTSIERAILHIYENNHEGCVIKCCAPTGKASRRMSEASGYKAQTIHSMLNVHEGMPIDEVQTLDADLIVVDEVSMLDIFLAEVLFAAVKPGAQLVMIGDADQLPSVGPGAVLNEFIKSKAVPVAKLETVHRQAGGSLVATNAFRIRTGSTKLTFDQGNGQAHTFQFFASNDMEQSAEWLSLLYQKEASVIGINNIALLTPYKQEKYVTGSISLNARIQEAINPHADDKPELVVGGPKYHRVFRKGDRVMQTANKDGVSNGDTGIIVDIRKDEDGDSVVKIRFEGGRYVELGARDMDIIDLAYAYTIHKSQGSEYQTVIISLQKAYYMMLNRSLLYTAVTRAKERVIIVGEREAILMAINKLDTTVRSTQLAMRLVSYTSNSQRRDFNA